MGKKQIQGPRGTWDHARQTSCPPMVKSHERAHSKNTLDPAKGPAPDKGQTAGGSRQGGKRGSGAE
jgi:hypothetical protein